MQLKQRADLLKNTKSSDHHVLAEDTLTVRYQGERPLGSRASLSDHMLVRLTQGSSTSHGSALSRVAAVYRHFLDDQAIDAIDWPPIYPDLDSVQHLWGIMYLCSHRLVWSWPGCLNPGLGGDPQAI